MISSTDTWPLTMDRGQKKNMQGSKVFHETKNGRIIHGDSVDVLKTYDSSTVDLIVTSPPFALLRKKDYGNAAAEEYLEWFRPFAEQFHRVLKDSGSLVIDIGGSWRPGVPARSLYHFKLLIMLCEEFDFELAQEFYWWNPSKLPTPAEWVTVRRVRVKDAVNTVWWLSKTPWPKADNRRILHPYSTAMKYLLKNGYKAKVRPSGHDISENFRVDNGAAIPPNLIAIPNTDSNGAYLRYCKDRGIKAHPARFPTELPEFFVRLTTDVGDVVVDPFAGSCVTGEVCERLDRIWACIDNEQSYLEGSLGRFLDDSEPKKSTGKLSYELSRPSVLWNGIPPDNLDPSGGQKYKRTKAPNRTG